MAIAYAVNMLRIFSGGKLHPVGCDLVCGSFVTRLVKNTGDLLQRLLESSIVRRKGRKVRFAGLSRGARVMTTFNRLATATCLTRLQVNFQERFKLTYMKQCQEACES